MSPLSMKTLGNIIEKSQFVKMILFPREKAI